EVSRPDDRPAPGHRGPGEGHDPGRIPDLVGYVLAPAPQRHLAHGGADLRATQHQPPRPGGDDLRAPERSVTVMGFWSWLLGHRVTVPPPPPVRTVAVVLGRNQIPIPDAKVTLVAGAWTRGGPTNRDGYLAFSGLPAAVATVTVTIAAPGRGGWCCVAGRSAPP